MPRLPPLVPAATLALATTAANASGPQSRALGATNSAGGNAPTRKALSWPLDNIFGEQPAPWSCGSRFAPPEYPGQKVILHNGVALADTCFKGPGPFHVYVIGDWGGRGSPPKAAHEWVRRDWVDGADDEVQQRIARLMVERAQQPGHEPDYILNMGDNFYWAGLEAACTEPTDWSEQWINVYENIYAGPGIDGKQWLGVLGNHDYGGFRFDMGWPQNIVYTWTPGGRWMTPAQYYSAKVHYLDFAVDYFFVDSNVFDAFPIDQNLEHNICSIKHNPNSSCPGQGGPADVWECPSYFKDMWQRQYDWLKQRLDTSSADWQIVVTHFPPTWGAKSWAALSEYYGIDLFLSGHVHSQHFWDKGDEKNPIKPTPVIISGGGGGITSESDPRPDGHDDEYGFVDLTMAKTQIVVEMISHQGILRKTGVVLQRGRGIGPGAPPDPTSPRPPSPDPEGPEQLQRRAAELLTAQATWTARKAEWIARNEQAAEGEKLAEDGQAAVDEKPAEDEKVAEDESPENEKAAEDKEAEKESVWNVPRSFQPRYWSHPTRASEQETSAWEREMLVGVVVLLVAGVLCIGGWHYRDRLVLLPAEVRRCGDALRETMTRRADELRWATRRKGTHDPLPQVPPCSELLSGRSATAAAAQFAVQKPPLSAAAVGGTLAVQRREDRRSLAVGGTFTVQRREDSRSWLDDRLPGSSAQEAAAAPVSPRSGQPPVLGTIMAQPGQSPALKGKSKIPRAFKGEPV